MNAPVSEVLFVCTGNVCRSPSAQWLLSTRGGDAAIVSSAGLHALVGSPVDPPMAKLVRASGGDVSDFRARQLTGELVSAAALILTMTSEHRREVVELAPAAVRRVFQLDEFAWLLGQGIEGDGIPDLVARAGSARARLIAGAGYRPSDIPDPYRRGDVAAQIAFSKIHHLVESIAPALYPAVSL